MDMVDDASRSQAILIVTAVFLSISLVTVCLRIFVRTRVVKAFGWDDIFMVVAMVSKTCENDPLILSNAAIGPEPRIRYLWHIRCQVWHGKKAGSLCDCPSNNRR